MAKEKILPKHIGIIMDGNGRWAKLRGLPRKMGHKIGAEAFRRVVRYCNRLGIEYLTVYAFSTENWKRPEDEIKAIISLLRDYLIDAKNYSDENVKTRFIGDLSIFDQEIRDLVVQCEQDSAHFTGLTLNIAFNYGGRSEILQAVQGLAADAAAGRIAPSDIDETLLSSRLYTAGMPDVDLVIRPSGEQRISNFLIWQSAYAEFIYMDVLWPDFNEKWMDKALEEYSRRHRRFGGI